MMKKTVWGVLLMTAAVFAGDKILYSVDFTKQPKGDAISVLTPKGYEFLLDSKKLNPTITDKGVEMSTHKQLAGLWGLRLKQPLHNVGYVVIEWGVERFPQGANWEQGKNRLALGAIIALGKQKFTSGVPFAPSAPYFFGPFIGEKEKAGKRYLGKLYKKSGRYYCVSNQKGLVKTRFEIDKKFRQEFGTQTPPVVAFGFQMNTQGTQGGAKAFVKKITFYSK